MMSTDYLTIADAGAALRRGEVSAQELMARALSRADALDEAIGVFISRYTESAPVPNDERPDAVVGDKISSLVE